MPELPEVETMRRGILPLVGSRVVDVRLTPCERRPILFTPDLATFRKQIQEKEIAQIDRLGKRVVVVLEDEGRILFEPRMTGLVLLADPPTQDHLRVHFSLHGTGPADLWYWDRRGLGSVRYYSDADYAAEFAQGKLGPDALDVDLAELRLRFATSRQPIKVALLDQKRLAGIGNLYAAEILHRAKIHPERTTDRLTAPQWKRLFDAMQEVLLLAIQYEGSTLGDGTYRNALNQDGGYQNQHRVYARAGSVCASCGKGTIVRIVQAQRATFFCPKCQGRK